MPREFSLLFQVNLNWPELYAVVHKTEGSFSFALTDTEPQQDVAHHKTDSKVDLKISLQYDVSLVRLEFLG